ncbi:MAG: hypothetical protein KBD16_04215, partial [Candidatus Pacebacteria bacterium]|nr:hypothetical protein [Candidatus Paceibacterota bacterium]
YTQVSTTPDDRGLVSFTEVSPVMPSTTVAPTTTEVEQQEAAIRGLLVVTKEAHGRSGHSGNWIPWYADYMIASGRIPFFTAANRDRLQQVLWNAHSANTCNPNWVADYAKKLLELDQPGPCNNCQLSGALADLVRETSVAYGKSKLAGSGSKIWIPWFADYMIASGRINFLTEQNRDRLLQLMQEAHKAEHYCDFQWPDRFAEKLAVLGQAT